MLINTQNLQFLFLQFLQTFQVFYSKQPTYFQFYASEMPSSTETNVYGWIAEMSGMVRWTGARQIDDVVARDYSLKNADWEKTIALERNKVMDDTWQLFGNAVEMLALQGAWWPDDVCTQTLVDGISVDCFDGQPYFDTDHPVDLDDASKGTYSNLLVGAQYSLAANPVVAWQNAKATAMKYKGESGRPLNVILDTLMCPPDLELYALQVANAQLTAQAIRNVAGSENVAAAGVTNVWQGSIRVIVNPRLTDQAVWYGLCTTRGVKPVIFQKRQAPNFVPLTAPTDPNVFSQKKFIYGSDARGEGGYSLPYVAVRCSPS